MMKFSGLKFIALALALAAPAVADEGGAARQGAQRSADAAADVTVSLCLQGGDVLVRGWDQREVRASAAGASRLDLRRPASAAASGPASRVEVSASDDRGVAGCAFSGSVALDVPRGASVEIKTITARVSVAEVASARVETVSGDVDLQGVSKSADASSANGDLSLRKSTGRVRLYTISASIDATDAAAAAAGDQFFAKTTSGDIILARVGHSQVEAETTSGRIDFAGALARGGLYTLKCYSGTLTVTLPAESSFLLNARVAHGEMVTEFPIRQTPGPKPESLLGGAHSTMRLYGVAGQSDKPEATLTLSSFSGTMLLRKSAGS